jgi:hypothetical protein
MTSLIILVVVDISEFSAPISDMLHPHNAITLQPCLLAVKNVLPIQTKFYYELLHRTKFPMSLPVHINFSSESNLTVVPSVVCHPYYKCYFLPKNKIQQKLQAGALYLLNMSGVMGYLVKLL